MFDSGVELSIGMKRLSTRGRKILGIPLCEMRKAILLNGEIYPLTAIIGHISPYLVEMSCTVEEVPAHLDTRGQLRNVK